MALCWIGLLMCRWSRSLYQRSRLERYKPVSRSQESKTRQRLRSWKSWLDTVLVSYGVLPMDAFAFREWARLMYKRSDAISDDAMIAATAIVHRLTVVTRNVRDFERLGVEFENPFESG